MSEDNLTVIRRFCDAFSDRDADALTAFFEDDAVYHNMPGPPVQGKAAIKAVLQRFLTPAKSVEFIMLNIAGAGDVVLTERLDRFVMGGRTVELPVAGGLRGQGRPHQGLARLLRHDHVDSADIWRVAAPLAPVTT